MASTPMNDPEVQEGIDMLESIWYLTAIKLVELAIQVYKLDVEQARALKDVFLKQNNYYVDLT
jgi:hypothetical protein